MRWNLWDTTRINSRSFFNIFINDSSSQNPTFVDKTKSIDKKRSSYGEILGQMLHNLTFDLGYILNWFRLNSLKLNPGKFQLMILATNANIKINLFLDGNKNEKSQEVVLLGVTIDEKLLFKMHIENISRTAKYKVVKYR